MQKQFVWEKEIYYNVFSIHPWLSNVHVNCQPGAKKDHHCFILEVGLQPFADTSRPSRRIKPRNCLTIDTAVLPRLLNDQNATDTFSTVTRKTFA